MSETGATESGAEAEEAQAPAEAETATSEASVFTKAKGRGEDAVRRLSAELDKNERTHQALERLNEARERVEDAGRTLLKQLNLAPRNEVEELKKEVDLLEKRLAMVESQAAKPPERTDAES